MIRQLLSRLLPKGSPPLRKPLRSDPETEIRSSIDLGTNTCLLLLAEVECRSGRVLKTLEDHSTVVRLGQGVDRDRKLHPEAMKRTLDCLRRYSEAVRARALSPQSTVAVATSQARDARNGEDFFVQVEKETGFLFRTISGQDEARFTFVGGLLPGMSPRDCAVIDIGGGSTEYMGLSGGQSLDLGSVRFTERYFKSDPVLDPEFWACQAEIDQQLEGMLSWRRQLGEQAQLVAVAGTATTLAAWHLGLPRFDRDQIDGLELTRGDVHRMVEELKWRSVSERKKLPGVEEGRADVLLAGALILWRSMEILGFRNLRVSTRGLRYGLLMQG